MFATVGQVAPATSGLTRVVSLGGLSFALLQGWPLWAAGVATVLPWLPRFTMDIAFDRHKPSGHIQPERAELFPRSTAR